MINRGAELVRWIRMNKTPASRQFLNLSEGLRESAESEVAEHAATIAQLSARLDGIGHANAIMAWNLAAERRETDRLTTEFARLSAQVGAAREALAWIDSVASQYGNTFHDYMLPNGRVEAIQDKARAAFAKLSEGA